MSEASLHQCAVRPPHVDLGFCICCARQVPFQGRRACLFDLEKERVILIQPLEEHHNTPRAHAADADDLPGDVDRSIRLQQHTAFVWQRASRRPRNCRWMRPCQIGGFDSHENGRVALETPVSFVLFSQF